MAREKLYVELLELFRLFQKRNRFVGSAIGTVMGLSDSHILVEIDAAGRATAKRLAEIIGLEKSTLSRAIGKLSRRGYITVAIADQDARVRVLSLTGAGSALLASGDERANRMLALFTASLSGTEENSLRTFFGEFSDAFGAAAGRLRPADHPLRLEIRRFTRALGLLGNNFMDSGLTPVQWQVLSEIRQRPKTTARALCAELHVAANTMSVMLARLEGMRCISRRALPTDRRSSVVVLEPKGRTMLQAVERAAAVRFAVALGDLSQARLRSGLKLFRKFVSLNPELSADVTAVLQEELGARRLTTAAELGKARGFLVLQQVRLNLHELLPEVLLGRSSYVFGLYSGVKLRAVCEIQGRGRGWWLEQFVTEVDLERSELAAGFLRYALSEFFRQERTGRVRVPEHSPASIWAVEGRLDRKFIAE